MFYDLNHLESNEKCSASIEMPSLLLRMKVMLCDTNVSLHHLLFQSITLKVVPFRIHSF